jgi:hypothetical protein
LSSVLTLSFDSFCSRFGSCSCWGLRTKFNEDRDFLGSNPPVPYPLRHHQDHRAVTIRWRLSS